MRITIKTFTLKWGKDNELATSPLRYLLEGIKKVVILESVNIEKGSPDLLIG